MDVSMNQLTKYDLLGFLARPSYDYTFLYTNNLIHGQNAKYIISYDDYAEFIHSYLSKCSSVKVPLTYSYDKYKEAVSKNVLYKLYCADVARIGLTELFYSIRYNEFYIPKFYTKCNDLEYKAFNEYSSLGVYANIYTEAQRDKIYSYIKSFYFDPTIIQLDNKPVANSYYMYATLIGVLVTSQKFIPIFRGK